MHVLFGFQRFFFEGYCGNLSKAYLRANMVTTEAVSSIQIVATFYGKEKVVDLFSRELGECRKKSFR
jgi:ATP-binding cassette subfamily B (MDR/TAP) protein 1